MFDKEEKEAKAKEKENGIDITDLNELNTKNAADEGVWMHLEVRGKKYDVEVKIFGSDSDVVQDYNRKVSKEQMKKIKLSSSRNVEFDDETVDEMLENTNDPALVRFGGIRRFSDKSPLKVNGNDIPTEKTDSCVKLYDGILTGTPDIKDFIMTRSSERDRFLSCGKKN